MKINLFGYQAFYLIYLIIFLCLKTECHIEKQTYQSQTNTGQWRNIITAEPQQFGDPARYFLCGFAQRQMQWTKLLYNCNCGNRMESVGVVNYKCDWCSNTFWSMRNGFKAIFCSINNWSNKITKIYETGNTESRNWKQFNCPKGFYVKQAAGRLGVEQQTILGFTGMQMICSNLEQDQIVKVEDPSKHCLEQLSDNSVGTFVSAVQVKSELSGKITGMKWIFEGIAYIKEIQMKYGEISGSTKQYTIESLVLKNAGKKTEKYQIALTKQYIANYTWMNKLSFYSGFPIDSSVEIKPPQQKMDKDESLYTRQRSKFIFDKLSYAKLTPRSYIVAPIVSSSNVTISTVAKELRTNVSYEAKLNFYDKTTGQFIVQRTIGGVFIGLVETPITMVFEENQCIGGWEKNNFVFNGDFEINKCLDKLCVYNQITIQYKLPGWIPNPDIQIGKGFIYNAILGNTWVAQMDVSSNSCFKQKIKLNQGIYQLTFDRIPVTGFSLQSNQMQVKFDNNSIRKIFPEDYSLQKQTIQITIPESSKEHWLEFCALGKGQAYGMVIDNVKMVIYNNCANVNSQKY